MAWGSADFAGGLQTRAAPMPAVLIISRAAGLTLLVSVLAVSGRPPPGWHQVALALAAGALGALELGLLYLAISRGPVIVVAPVAAAGAVLPVIAGAMTGNHLGAIALLGIACALAGAAVVSPIWAAAAIRAGGLSSALAFLLVPRVRRQIWTPRPARMLAAMAGLGVLDASGDLSFAFASTRGQLAVVAVLASLYPVVTVLLAAGVLRERVRPTQAIGAIVALVGIILLAAA